MIFDDLLRKRAGTRAAPNKNKQAARFHARDERRLLRGGQLLAKPLFSIK